MEEVNFNDDGYNEDFLREVRELAMIGLTDEEMMRVWGMDKGQWRKFKEDKVFSKALMEGRLKADREVVVALHKRATGYYYEEDRVGFYKGEAIKVRYQRYSEADPWSAVAWMKIHHKPIWSEKHQIEVTNTNININKIDFSGLSEDEMLTIRQIQKKQLEKYAGGN
jgi:hypothetical protein